jgi:hypothetical protein
VFSDLKHDGFLDQAQLDPGLREVYRDRGAIIFAVETANMPQGQP